ncbi:MULTISPECIES: hypothetical protein [Streptomyces]|uniref:hypothetical protein n=1 Tax=Streptomyces TaxID=1883 RepID=UPI00131A1EB4|nr:hypothetical protein [Streptomyces chartreusis]MYS91462.1 hypothetical protein [Streptomyces sp. SID5464]
MSNLTGVQTRGASCAWCQTPLTIETAVDLGERPGPGGVTIFPRGCCTCVRSVADRVYKIHVAKCSQCLRNQHCPDRDGLRHLASESAP